MNLKKLFTKGLVCLSLILTGCNTAKTQTSGTKSDSTLKELNYIYVHTTNTLDPHLKGSSYIPLRAGIVETLFKMDDNSQVKPWLVDTYSSDNCINWTFNLKSDVKFHNGVEMTASIVKENIEIFTKKNPGIAKNLDIKSIKADGLKLEITTNKANSSLPSEFVHPNTAIIDIKAKDIDTTPMGTGPFKVENFIANTSVNLIKNDAYWDGKVKLDKVNFQFNEDANARLQALQSGCADAIFKPSLEAVDILKQDPNYTIDSVPGLRTHKVLYNVRKTPISDKNFRYALDSLINRQEIVDTIMAGQATVAYGPFMEQFPFSIDYEKSNFNIDTALSFFEKAGLKVDNKKVTYDNGGTVNLKLITYNSRPELPQIATLIQANAKQIGINIEIQLVEDADKYMTSKSDWDMTIYSLLTAPRGDAGYYLNSSFLPDSSMNFGKINDGSLISSIQDFNTEKDDTAKLSLAKKATTILTENKYNSYIAYPNIVVAYNKKRVLNWKTVPSEYYMITKDLDVK